MRKTLYLALAMLLATVSLALPATTTTPVALSTTAYTDLGAGPIALGAANNQILYQITDSQPAASAPGNVQEPGDPPAWIATSSHVWAIGSAAGSRALVTAGTGITSAGNSGTPTQTTVSVATSSTTVLAASTATTFLKLCVALGAANGVWVRWDGAAATAAPPAELVPPGQCDTWVKAGGFLPTSQINAIASATVSISLIYN